jgi:hypothetical protein
MTDIPDPREFIDAPLIERAVLLLRGGFRQDAESASRINVAQAIANGVDDGVGGSPMVVGTRGADPAVLRLVSEAWLILEQALCICPDLAHPEGDWWVLTMRGRTTRDSGDPDGEIRLALSGNL